MSWWRPLLPSHLPEVEVWTSLTLGICLPNFSSIWLKSHYNYSSLNPHHSWPEILQNLTLMSLILDQWKLNEIMYVKVLPQSLTCKCSVNDSCGHVLLKDTYNTYGPREWWQSHVQLALEGTHQIDGVLYPNSVGIHYIMSCLSSQVLTGQRSKGY